MTLSGKSALVTGASRGIGQAIAVSLAGAGATVFCVSTRPGGCDETVGLCDSARREALGSDHEGRAVACATDVSNEDAVGALAEEVLGKASTLDILVNNAGITKDGLFLRMSADDFDSVVAVNMRGTYLMCRAFARPMTKARWGRMVNVGSIVGLTGNAGQANYAASKAAIVGFSKSLARELGSRGVTVNVVAPGFVETDMTKNLPEEIKTESLKNIPLGRFGSPQDVAGAVGFLCSDAAAYVTGQVLVVDGGMAM